VGRDVHYVARGSADGVFPSVCRAAKITEVVDQEELVVNVIVFNPGGIFFDRALVYDEDTHPGTWHWPERVGD
jgi:hypothetical protein